MVFLAYFTFNGPDKSVEKKILHQKFGNETEKKIEKHEKMLENLANLKKKKSGKS